MKSSIWEMNLEEIFGATEEPTNQMLTLFIPNKDRNNVKISNHGKWVREAQKILTVIGGGATALPPADGSWIDPKKKVKKIEQLKEKDIIWEKTTIIYTYVNGDNFIENMKYLREFLHRFGKETNQGEVGLVFDDRLYKIRM